jgi:hypothetical protein
MDAYFDLWGDPFVEYAPTVIGFGSSAWNPMARRAFFERELPDLRKHARWGYSFGDGRNSDSWKLMFHGYFPVSEKGKTSFYWFEFDWQVNPTKFLEFVNSVMSIVTCMSGYGGFMFQYHPTLVRSSYNQIFVWARRYWGVEVQDIDVTSNYMGSAYKCVNWITIVGERLREQNPEAIEQAKRVAYGHHQASGGMVFQASHVPELGDRNRSESLPGYVLLAEALRPIQAFDHREFAEGSGSRWTQDASNAWLRRLTDPAWSRL